MSNHKEILDSIGVVLKDVVSERLQQEQKWGEQNHKQIIWLGILAEEFGEAAKEINELHFRPGGSVALDKPDQEHILHEQRKRVRDELIQTIAVGVAMVESFDRNGR